jgi:hypothetical protein
MDPIRPIGPLERDLEPVVRVTRSSPDGQREPRERPEQPPRRPRPAPQPEQVIPGDDPDNHSLIDIKV